MSITQPITRSITQSIAKGITSPHGSALSPLHTGLLHFWDLDDDGTWADSVGDWDLDETNNPTVNATGGPDSDPCAEFSKASVQSLSLTTAKEKAWDGAQDNFSVSGWYRMASVTSNMAVFSWRRGVTTKDLYYAQYNNSGVRKTLESYLWDGAAAGNFNIDATPDIGNSVGTWYHYVATWDGTTHRLYVDAVDEQDNNSDALGAFTTDAMALSFGVYSDDLTTSPLDGRLGPHGIWDRTLTSDEVTTLYNGGSFLKYASL